MRTGWDSGRVVFFNSCSQANKIWGALSLGQSRICEKPPQCHTCIPFAGWQKLHIQHAFLLPCLTTSSLGSCFRSIWTLVKLRFTEFLPRAFLTHHMVYPHVTHFSSKSLLQTSKRIQEWMKSCWFFSKSLCGNRFFLFLCSWLHFQAWCCSLCCFKSCTWKSSRIKGNPYSSCAAELSRLQVIIWCKKENEGVFMNMPFSQESEKSSPPLFFFKLSYVPHYKRANKMLILISRSLCIKCFTLARAVCFFW